MQSLNFKKMKFSKLNLLLVLVWISLFAFSQEKSADISSSAAAWTSRMNVWLQLDTAKITSLTKINEETLNGLQKAFGPVRTNPQASKEEKKQALQQAMDVRKKREKDLNRLFSPAEWERYQAHKQENQAGFQAKMLGRQLGLTTDQEEKIEIINLEAIRKVSTGVDRENFRQMNKQEKRKNLQALKKIQDEKEQAYAKVLTPEQMKTYLENKEERREAMKEQRKRGN
jgi:hypothetical protein